MVYRLDPEIIIGLDSISRAGSLSAALGGKVLLITEQNLYEGNAIGRLMSVLEQSGTSFILFDEISAQSTTDLAQMASALARGSRCTVVMGFGGLRTQSISRMAAMIANSNQDIFDLMDGAKYTGSFIPYVAIPAIDPDPFMFTNYYIALDPRDRLVKLVKSPAGLCRAAILDGGLFANTLTGKFASTAAFDGFCTAVEAYCSTKSSFFSDGILEQAIASYSNMIKSQTDSSGPDFLESFINAAFLMAMGSSISAPGIGTALAYSLNVKFPVAKSWCSTVILPYILEKLAAARPDKMAKIAALMGEPVEGSTVAESAAMVADSIRNFIGLLKVPARLKEFNLVLDRMVPAAEAARDLEFVSFSPYTVASENAFDILKQAF